jgi:hypothetical protein
MSRDRRTPPKFEPLEGKLLLSASPATMPPAHGAVILDGNFTSNVKSVKSTGTPMVTVTEPFAGQSRSLGRVKATLVETADNTTGSLLSAGIVLQNAKGSVHLVFGQNDLVSQTSTKASSTQVLAYTIDHGTGAYANAGGAGTFTMTYVFKSGVIRAKLHST